MLEQQIAETFKLEQKNALKDQNFATPFYSAGSFRPNKLEPARPAKLPDYPVPVSVLITENRLKSAKTRN